MDGITYYELLDVPEDATREQIRKAYLKSSRLLHPDHGGSDRQFRALSVAYNVLYDPEKRTEYDQRLRSGGNAPAAPAASPSWGTESAWHDDPPPSPQPPPPTFTPPRGPSWEPGAGASDRWVQDLLHRQQEQRAQREREQWLRDQDRLRQEAESRQVAEQAAALAAARQARINRRRSNDAVMLWLGVIGCLTVVVPWIIGRFFLEGRTLRPTGSGVYRGELRSIGRYFLTDWTAGCVVVLLLAVAFVLLRPWTGRASRLVVAGLIGVVAVAVLLPYSVQEWGRQEAVTASRLRNTVYPLDGETTVCGQNTVALGKSQVEPGKPSISYTLYAVDPRRTFSDCSRLELWAGWRRVKIINLAKGQAVSYRGSDAITTDKPPWTLKKATFTVELTSGKKLKYPLAKMLG